ncbi:MAG: hypothetical protein IKF80_08630 [Erysipelotrichaceae bacterium]|nr:hypothetical protein [Erysipelotrichaceae bacterium]
MMIEFPRNDRWCYEGWFYFDEEYFSDETIEYQLKIRTYKGVGRDNSGRLILHHQIYQDPGDWRKFSSKLYEIDKEEYAWLLDRAISQKKADKERRDDYLSLVSANIARSWNSRFNMIVYMDESYAFVQERQTVYFVSRGRCYKLSCHPYEPCTYIDTGKDTAICIHNAFDPFSVIETFVAGKNISSISGKIYDRKQFCEMLDFMIDNYSDTDISYLEGAMAIRKMKQLDITSPEKAIEVQSLGLRKISENFSHSRKLNERVMYTADGKVYLKIRNKE